MYRYLIIVAIVLLGSLNDGLSQKTNETSHLTWVKTIEFNTTHKGYIQYLGDSTLMIKKKTKMGSLKVLYVSDIQHIKIRRRHRITKGLLIGGIGGFLIGNIIGRTSPDRSGSINFDGETKGLMLGTLFVIPGSILGGVIGGAKIKFNINGEPKKYQQAKEKLKRRLF